MSAPDIRLVNLFSQAYDNFVATARTCYSAKGIVTPLDVSGPADAEASLLEQKRERKYALAQSLFKAGHHTTLQHAHAQFAMDGISRHFIWSFLHAHPFYNSEQVSQRYVAVKAENFHVPEGLSAAGRALFIECVERQMAAYHELTEMLKPVVAEEYYARFKGRYDTKRATIDIKKRAQEVGRYALPLATHAYLYHTVSVVTLLRYYRLCCQYDAPAEQRTVVSAMVAELLRAEPEFETVLQEPIPLEETPEFLAFQSMGLAEVDTARAKRFTAEFDAELGGKFSVLADYGARNQDNVAAAVREVLGLPRADLSDVDAIGLVLNPAKNHLMGDNLNLSTISKLSRALYHAHYTFKKVLSHAGDSQDQRHRMTPGARPVLMSHFTGEPDFIVPAPAKQNDAVLRRYNDAMADSWQAVNALLAMGEPAEYAAYLLPNAVKVRFTESGDLLNLHHKMAMRLCYNAQEEIWCASLDEALAITAVNPEIGRWLLPPCGIRKHAGAKPICPEGDRYCGVPVWRLNREDYTRVI